MKAPSRDESTFRTVFETAGSAIIVFALDGTIREFNPAAERLHGCSRDVAVGKHYISLFIPKETRAALRAEITKLAAEGGRDLEIAIEAHDGQTRVISWNGNRLVDADGRTTGMVAIGQDVTARRQAERALQDSERRYRELADATPVLVWMSVADGRCTYINEAWLEFTGLSRAELLGFAWMELIHPDDQAQRFEYYMQGMANQTEFTMDHRTRCADGTYRWVYGTATPRFESDGSFNGFVGCSIDITERRRAEEELRRINESLERRVARRTAELSATVRELQSEIAERKEAASRLESVVSNSPDFIFQVSRDGRITFLNRSLDDPPDQVVGRSMYGYLHRDSHPRVAEALERVFGHGLTDHFEAGVVGSRMVADGAPFMFDISPVTLDDKVESAVVNARDISAALDAQGRLRALEAELAHAVRMSTMGEMAAAIAHELHQPLAAVVNYAGACTELVRGNTAEREELLSYLEQVSGQTLRAGEIIQRMRGFIEKKEPEEAPLTLNGVIEHTALLLEAEARHHRVELDLALADDPPTLLGDRVQLQQVIVNLVKNAVEATGRNGTSPRRVRIETAVGPKGGIVEVRVSDTGPGLSAAERAKVFEPFYSTKPTGMGLGLSISRSIAEAHGGTLVVRDAPGMGATFCLVLPTLSEGDPP